jgi:hypothetical protein
LEVTAGELLLEALESELLEVRGSVGRLAPEEAQRRESTLGARLRSHIVDVLASVAAATAPVGASPEAGEADDGSTWLAKAAAARAARTFREPLAAAALEVIADLEDPEFSLAIAASLPSIVALIEIGRPPVSVALAALFSGPLAAHLFESQP